MGNCWEAKGYSGAGNVAGLIDSLRERPAIIVGSARGGFSEVEAAQRSLHEPVVYAVNDVSVFLPHVDHMVSHHIPRLVHWAAIRRDPTGGSYGNVDFCVHDSGFYGKTEWYQWSGLTPVMALSGLFAAQIAYLMGCDPVVLAGCPTDDTPRFWETCEKSSNVGYKHVQTQIRAETNYKPEFKNAVRSMSGWSKEFFGGLER